MSKFRSLILIIGLTVIAVAAALLTVLVLYATGTIVTDPIKLVYEVGSEKKFYDGTPLTLDENGYRLVSGEILEGHTAQVKVIGSQTNAGESECTLEVKIFDKNGFDVSDEYAVKVNTGTLTVEKQILSVSVESDEVYYSGKEIVFNKYEVTEGELVRGHKLGGVSGTLINAGDSLPKNVAPVVYDAFDNDVTANYDFGLFDIGDVTVIPRPVTLKPKDFTKVYDGIPFIPTEYEIVSGSLAPGHTAKCTIVKTDGFDAEFTDYTGVNGERIKVNLNTIEIKDENGDLVNLKNYDCTTETATVKIEKRTLTIATATQTFTYDGDAHYNDTVQLFSGTLAPGQKISVKNHATVTKVKDGPVVNELQCVVTLNNGDAVDQKNYDITYIEGTLSVKPFDLTVYTKSYTKEYDGKPLSDIMGNDVYELSVHLPEKFTLTAQCPDGVKTLVDATKETYYTLKVISITAEGEDGTIDCIENFNINVRGGTYSITKKPVTIELNRKLEDDYNGKVYTFKNEKVFEGADFSECEGITAADFKVYGLYDIKTAGTHYYTAEYNGDSENYDITIVTGVIKIKKKSVALGYNGNKVQVAYRGSDGYDSDDAAITAGLTINIGNVACTVNSAKFFIKPDKITVKSVTVYADGEDITSNLEIDYDKVNIPFDIIKRSFEFNLAPYTAYSVSDEATELIDCVTASGLADGDKLKVVNVSYESGDTEYGVGDYDIVNSDGVSVKKYYQCANPDAKGTINFIFWG